MSSSMVIPLASRSGLEAAHCGHRYNEIYNHGQADESDYSRRGTAYHDCMFFYAMRLKNAGLTMDAEEANKAFEEGIAHSMCPSHLIAEVREIFDRDVQHFELNLDTFVAVEAREMKIDGVPVPFIFRPDKIDAWPAPMDVLEVTDHKTYFRAFTEDQARELFQTRFYMWAAMQVYPGFRTYRMTYRFPRLNQSVSIEFADTEFPDLDREVRAAEAARQEMYRTNTWPAVPGDQCAVCSLRCPVLDDEKRALMRIGNDEEYAAAAGLKLVLEQQLKYVNAALKARATMEGPRVVNGVTFGHFPVVSKSYDAAAAVEAIKAAGHTPVFRVSLSKLKPAIKQCGPGLMDDEDLKASAKEETKYRFSGKTVKESAKHARTDEDDDES